MAQNPHTVKWADTIATRSEVNAAYKRLLRASGEHSWVERPGGKEQLREFLTSDPIEAKDLDAWVAREEARMARSGTKSDLIEKYTERLTKAYESHMNKTLKPENKDRLRAMLGRVDTEEEMEDVSAAFEAELKTREPVKPVVPVAKSPVVESPIIAKPVEESPPITDYELKVWQEQILEHVEAKREIDSKERTKIKEDVMKSLKAVQKSGDRKALEKSIAFLKAFHAASKDTSNEEIAKDTETLLKKPTKAVVAPPIITPPTTAPAKKAEVETVKKEPVKTLLKQKAKVEKAVATSGPKTELQKAREKAKAWWALHPSGMNQDMAHKAKAVVKTADKYQPSRNDFKGVDDKKYSVVRWK